MREHQNRFGYYSESRRGRLRFHRAPYSAWIRAIAALAVVFTFSAGMPATAAARQESEILKKHKLKAAGSLQVLENEAEFKSKLTDLKRLQKQLSDSIAQQRGAMSPEQFKQTVRNLKNEVNQMRSELNSVNQQIARVPRTRRGFANNMVREQHDELVLYRNQLKSQVDQETAWLNQLQSTQKADPKAKDRIDALVGDRRLAYQQALQDLRALADATTQKYAELAKDPEVKKAIDGLGAGKRDKPRLGPSRDFLNNVKALEKLEKALSASDSDPFREKPASRSRGKVRSRSKSAAPSKETAEKPGQS